MKQITHWINGRSWVGDAKRRGKIFDPATGLQTGEVDFATNAEVDAAVAAAAAAFPAWRATSLAKRTTALFKLRELLATHVDEVAAILTSEHGKVTNDAAGEVARGLEVVEFGCGIAQLLKGQFTENASTGVNVHTLRRPLGVVAGITPFNFPAMVPLWMFPLAIACGNTFVLKPSEKDPSASIFLAELVALWMFPLAIACGNTFVLKPSEKDPSASLLLAELLAEAGLPDGVFNVVHGGKEAGDALLAGPEGRAVRFVGSTPVARYIYETGTSAGKRV